MILEPPLGHSVYELARWIAFRESIQGLDVPCAKLSSKLRQSPYSTLDSHLDRQRQACKRDRLVAPVELVGLPRREALGT
jgi:hypothetical protein